MRRLAPRLLAGVCCFVRVLPTVGKTRTIIQKRRNRIVGIAERSVTDTAP
jgi:hypothetical protein